jgi:hypothetical protein
MSIEEYNKSLCIGKLVNPSTLDIKKYGLNRQSFGDPLGLGIVERFIPPDPDHDINNNEEIQRQEFCKMFNIQYDDVHGDNFKNSPTGKYLTIDEVRKYCSRYNLSTEKMDTDSIIYIDSNINYKLFFIGDSIFTREEVYKRFAFLEMNTSPELQFDCKFVCEYFNERDGSIVYITKNEMSIRDDEVRPKRIARTKIYTSGVEFERFLKLSDITAATIAVSRTQTAENDNILSLMGIVDKSKFNTSTVSNEDIIAILKEIKQKIKTIEERLDILEL